MSDTERPTTPAERQQAATAAQAAFTASAVAWNERLAKLEPRHAIPSLSQDRRSA